MDFNQLPPASIVPDDHISLTNLLPPPSTPHTSPTPIPTPSLVDAVRDRDLILAGRSQRTTRAATGSLPASRHHYNDIETINMFVSINEIDVFLATSPDITHDSLHNDPNFLYDHCFLSAPPFFLRPRSFDLSKPPNSYHEAINRPDKAVWLAAMQREIDSLEERKAFERTSLPVGRKAIGVR